MSVEWSCNPSKGLVIKRGESVLVDEAGRAYDTPSDSCYQQTPSADVDIVLSSTAGRGGGNTKKLTRIHDQSAVVDASGVAYNVRLHLTEHLRTIARVETLETTILGECWVGVLVVANTVSVPTIQSAEIISRFNPSR